MEALEFPEHYSENREPTSSTHLNPCPRRVGLRLNGSANMRTSQTLVASNTPVGHSLVGVEDGIRRLVELIKSTKDNGRVKTSGGSSNFPEEVVLDVDVEGYRYLLLRMPKLEQNRIRLSPREHEIVRMVAKGHPNKVIADVLNISSWTVCTHLRRIFAKLGVGSRAAMVAQLMPMEFHGMDHRDPAHEK